MSAAANFRLNVLGQALIQHDLRAHPWPDFSMSAAMLRPVDLCFSDLGTAARSPKRRRDRRGNDEVVVTREL
jgi:hypothetical protein